jgi:5'-methylthioadenosine phosphorylase
VIGGTGLYHFEGLKDLEVIEVDTPFGKPSTPVTIGTISGKRVAFLARHGAGHFINPSEVNYRANIYALKSLGVKRILGVSACGSLREDYAPGQVVIPDQLFDFTRGARKNTFFEGGLVAHVGAADPFCTGLSEQIYDAVSRAGSVVHKGGTFITIEGPRFSTKAESRLFRSWDMSIIGMTTSPEAFLAAHVTDYDVWHISEEAVSVEMIIRILNENTSSIQKAITLLVAGLDPDEPCECHQALANALVTQPGQIPTDARRKLALFVDKYLSQ